MLLEKCINTAHAVILVIITIDSSVVENKQLKSEHVHLAAHTHKKVRQPDEKRVRFFFIYRGESFVVNACYIYKRSPKLK